MRQPPYATSLLALFLVLGVALPALAKSHDKGRPTQPGKYTEWNGEIDELEIVETFKLGDYQRVVVSTFETSGTPLPEPKDNTYEPVKKVLADVSTPLLDGLRDELPKGLSADVIAGDSALGPGTLLIRGKVDIMDPGSKAARYWGGFGAGAARTGLSGEIADAATGRVLLRFKQERRSGLGLFGGDYVKLMNRNLRSIGKDLAGVLAAF